MTKRISRRRRKLAPRRALAFMVSAGSGCSVELTLYGGRRSLSRELDARDVRTLVQLLKQTSPLLPDLRSTDDLQPSAVAVCAARWFSAAGSHIAFPACPTDVAREEGSAKAGFLAAAMELRDLLAQSTDGRQALRDLGFEPLLQDVKGE